MPSVISYWKHSREDLFYSSFPPLFTTLVLDDSWTGGIVNAQYLLLYLYHRERILETSTLSCNEEEEEITKPPKR